MNKKTNIDDQKNSRWNFEFKENIINLNFQKSSGQLEKTSQIKNTKKQIARLKTKLSKY